MNSLLVSPADKSLTEIGNPTETPSGYFKTRRFTKTGQSFGGSSQSASVAKSETWPLDKSFHIDLRPRVVAKLDISTKLEAGCKMEEAAVAIAKALPNAIFTRSGLSPLNQNPCRTGTFVSLSEVYNDRSIDNLKRSARALAFQSEVVDEEEENNSITCDRLPTINPPLRLTLGSKEEVEKPAAKAAKRSILPAPRTKMLGFGNSDALLSIIETVQDRRQKDLDKRKQQMLEMIEYQNARDNGVDCKSKKTNLDLKAIARPGVLKKALTTAVKALSRKFSQLIDCIAVA